MKLTIFFLIVVCLHVSAAGYGQNGTVTIAGKDLSLEKVFSVIKKQTDYVCFYGYDVLKDAKPVSLSFKNADVQEVLKAALWGQGLDFSITGKTITIMKKVVVAAASSAGPGRTVKAVGVVYNEAGQPLSGANVTIKATGKGTITNAKGEFELPAVPEGSPLVISFIGYAPQVVKVSEGTAMQVYLNVAKNELDKVVVQAYGTTTQRLATGNIATVTAAEIERQPVMNPLEALYGKVPGVVITQNNGYASAPINVEIRGKTNLNGTFADPLFIVDGNPMTLNGTGDGVGYGLVPVYNNANAILGPAKGQSPLFNINPADIETVTILKDADATAIYGSRGANGVIIITTKKGKPGKTKLDIDIYQGVNAITNHYDMLNTTQYVAMRREALKNDGLVPDEYNAYDLVTWDTTRYTDYQKYFWGSTGKETDIQAGISGGDKQTNFRLSGGYHHLKSVLAFSGGDERASVQFNLTHKSLNQKLSTVFTTQYSYTKSNMIELGGSPGIAPNSPAIFDSKGKLNFAGWAPISDQFGFGTLLQPYNANTGYLNSSLKLGLQLLKGLSIGAQVGYSTNRSFQRQQQPIISQDLSTNPTGVLFISNYNYNTSIIEPQVEYKAQVGKGKLLLLAGGSIQSTSMDGAYMVGTGYTNDDLLSSIANAVTKNADDASTKYRYAAAFGRLTYNWNDKYIVNLSARRDGSSRFGPGMQFGNFGSAGAAWIFTGENWVKKHLSFLSFGKLRASYGITGSDIIPNYLFLTSWSGAQVLPYNGTSSMVATRFANPLLHWQSNHKLEGAINIGVWNDRVTVELVWYRNRCGDQLLTYSLPAITGFTNVYANFPALVQNQGWESTIMAKAVDSKNTSLSFTLAGGINHNKLVSFPGLNGSAYVDRYQIGQPLQVARVVHYTGVDPMTGWYTFLDKNKDGQIVTTYNGGVNDLFSKDLSVKLDGGIGTDFQYKNFQLNIYFTFRIQQLPNAVYSVSPGMIGYNQPIQILDHWQKPGDHARYSRYTTFSNDNYAYYLGSDGIYGDGSYIRLKNISVAYDLPSVWVQKLGMQRCSFYIRAENLFILTRYNGLDPDVPNFGAMPPQKFATAGVKLNF